MKSVDISIKNQNSIFMNKLVLHTKNEVYEPHTGDLYLANNIDEIFILSIVAPVGDRFVAVSLKDGNRWKAPQSTIPAAVSGLTPLGSKYSVTVSK